MNGDFDHFDLRMLLPCECYKGKCYNCEIIEYFSKYEEVKIILKQWADLKGHNKCFHHPEILTKLCVLTNISIQNNPELPSEEEFKQGCEAYRKEIYPK